jgi:hypothetical protein
MYALRNAQYRHTVSVACDCDCCCLRLHPPTIVSPPFPPFALAGGQRANGTWENQGVTKDGIALLCTKLAVPGSTARAAAGLAIGLCTLCPFPMGGCGGRLRHRRLFAWLSKIAYRGPLVHGWAHFARKSVCAPITGGAQSRIVAVEL